jgi:hypothetical protein
MLPFFLLKSCETIIILLLLNLLNLFHDKKFPGLIKSFLYEYTHFRLLREKRQQCDVKGLGTRWCGAYSWFRIWSRPCWLIRLVYLSSYITPLWLSFFTSLITSYMAYFQVRKRVIIWNWKSTLAHRCRCIHCLKPYFKILKYFWKKIVCTFRHKVLVKRIFCVAMCKKDNCRCSNMTIYETFFLSFYTGQGKCSFPPKLFVRTYVHTKFSFWFFDILKYVLYSFHNRCVYTYESKHHLLSGFHLL